MSKKATTVEEIYHNFVQENYLDKETEEFYVNLYEKDLKLFVSDLSRNIIPSKSFFIAGQSGNGKSSVLHMLTTKYPELENKYLFNYITGREIFIYEDIDIVDILLMIGHVLTKDNEALQDKYRSYLQKVEDVKSGALVEEERTSKKEAGGLNVKAYAGVGTKFFSFLKAGGDFESTYKINEEVRLDARKLFKLNKNKLIDLINQIILDYKQVNATDKSLLIILDDLEKRENLDELFTKELYLLDELNLVKIITMPIHLQRTETFTRRDIREFGLKLKDFEGNEFSRDIKLLNEVINRRIEKKELISSSAINDAVQFSGGNLRQLIKLIHFAASEALAFDSTSIGQKEMEASFMKLQREYSSKVMMYRTFLNSINVHHIVVNDSEEELEKLAKVTKQSLIFAYFNGVIWYEVNPAIKKTLAIYNRVNNK